MQIFHALLAGYISLAVLLCEVRLVDKAALKPVPNSLFLILGGAAVSWTFSKHLSTYIGQRLLGKAQWGGDRGEGEMSGR